MSDELRDKAERLVDAYEHMKALFPALVDRGDATADATAVCRAYLAEHPADDDDEPVTQPWIADAVDWRDYKSPTPQSSRDKREVLLAVCNAASGMSKGLFRRLCKALGIELKQETVP